MSHHLERRLEKWMPFNKALEVSDRGAVRWANGREIQPIVGRGGYRFVEVPGQKKPFALHEMVARAFLGHEGPVRFKNRDRGDCRLDNLVPSGPRVWQREYLARERAERGQLIAPEGKHPYGGRLTPGRVRKLRDMAARGASRGEIRKALKISIATVYRWLAKLRIDSKQAARRDRRKEYRGCNDGRACGCSCHRG